MKVACKTVGPFQENTYFVFDEAARSAVIIDPGDEGDLLVSTLRVTGAKLEAIWLTHAHVDHVGGIAALRRVWSVPIYLHPADRPLYDGADRQAALYEIPFDPPPAPDLPLAEGDVMRVGGLSFDVMHLPGHAPGHVAFVGGGVAFVGDCLFAGSIGRTDLHLADPAQLEASLQRLAALPQSTIVYCGHGLPTTIGRERATNPFLTGLAKVRL